MARKIRIAVACSTLVGLVLVSALIGMYFAARQVRPFYEQALQIEPAVLEEGSREMESRATALYSDARRAGQWSALFSADQINGWLATQLAANHNRELPANLRDPRVAISPGVLTLGFRTVAGGIETVVSVDADVFLTEEGAVAIRLLNVRAGTLPLPVMQVADQLATACQELNLSAVRWTQEAGQPVALVDLHSDISTNKREFYIDSIELGERELYVAGHTEVRGDENIELSDYELRLTPGDSRSALEVARRPKVNTQANTPPDH